MRLHERLNQIPILVLGLLIGFSVLAFAATQQDYDDCSQTSDVARGIAACTRVIGDQSQSVADRANAYVQRGNDDVGSDKLNEAIGDYSAAIQLDARNVAAYAARAIAYLRKGSLDQAAADYRQANSIDAVQIGTLTSGSAELQQIAAASSAKTPVAGDRRLALPAGAELVPRESALALYSIDFSPQGDRIVGWSGSPDMVVMWDIVKGKLLWTSDDDNQGVGFVAFSPDGTRVASGGHDDKIRIRDAASGATLLTIEPKDTDEESVAFSPDGQWLAVADNDEKVELWDTTNGKRIRTLGGQPGCYCFASVSFSSDGKRIVSGYSDKSIKIWDPATGRLLRRFKAKSQALDAAFSPDGTRIVSGHDDNTVKVWEAATGRMLLSFVAHPKGVTTVVFSPDGAHIASGAGDWGGDSTVKVWDAASGSLLMSLQGHEKGVASIRFSPDGSRIASGSSDGIVKLWDGRTGALMASFAMSDGHGVAYTPAGLFVTDIKPEAVLKIKQGGNELPLGEIVVNRRDSLADVLKAATAIK